MAGTGGTPQARCCPGALLSIPANLPPGHQRACSVRQNQSAHAPGRFVFRAATDSFLRGVSPPGKRTRPTHRQTRVRSWRTLHAPSSSFLMAPVYPAMLGVKVELLRLPRVPQSRINLHLDTCASRMGTGPKGKSMTKSPRIDRINLRNNRFGVMGMPQPWRALWPFP